MEYIYLLKNNETGRIYVGRSRNVKRRFRLHMNALGRHEHNIDLMQSDYDLYGEQSFNVSIVEKAESFTKSGVEGWWMKRLKTYNKEYGYNYKDPYFLHRSGNPTKNGDGLEEIKETPKAKEVKERKIVIYDNIKKIAKEKNIPVYKIEDDCGYQRGAISKWNESSPSAKRLKVVADYLQTTVDELLKE